MRNLDQKLPLSGVKGLSFRHGTEIIHNPPRPLLENLDDLPFPGYHLVEEHMDKYHFKMMAYSGAGYALVEASRDAPINAPSAPNGALAGKMMAQISMKICR